MNTFHPIQRPRSVPQAAIRQIQEHLIRGDLRSGDQLPSERELAQRLGIGRSSLREAIQALQTMGLVDVRHGVGTFLVAAPDGWLLEPLKNQVQGRAPDELFPELIEARMFVETATASLAASRRDESQLEKLTVAVADCASARDGVAAGLRVHLAIAEAAQNEVLAVMVRAASELFHDILKSLQAEILMQEDGMGRLREFRASQQRGHEQLLSAIQRSDAVDASTAMRQHLVELRDFYAGAPNLRPRV